MYKRSGERLIGKNCQKLFLFYCRFQFWCQTSAVFLKVSWPKIVTENWFQPFMLTSIICLIWIIFFFMFISLIHQNYFSLDNTLVLKFYLFLGFIYIHVIRLWRFVFMSQIPSHLFLYEICFFLKIVIFSSKIFIFNLRKCYKFKF